MGTGRVQAETHGTDFPSEAVTGETRLLARVRNVASAVPVIFHKTQ